MISGWFQEDDDLIDEKLNGNGGGRKISFYRFNIRVALFYFIRKISFQGYKLIPYG